MTDLDDEIPSSSEEPGRDRIAEAFDIDRDPLAGYASTFQSLDVVPFAVARGELFDGDNAVRAISDHERVVEQWRSLLADHGRHPACPHEGHVRAFVHHCREDRENCTRTIKEKLRKLDQTYRFWQMDSSFPHGVDSIRFAS